MTEQGERRRRMPAWLVFTVLRILAFVVPLAVSYALGASLLLAAFIAAIVGFCLSVIFLSRQRRAFSGELAELRRRPAKPKAPEIGEDELVEDAVVDSRSPGSAPEQDSGLR